MKASDAQSRRYLQFADSRGPQKPILKNAVLAFLVGGTICAIGQVVLNLFVARGLPLKDAAPATSTVMIVAGLLLTGLGVYDEIGRVGGMGAALPITGFANSIAAPAMEFKREGFVLGVGARMFVVAGPVIVYGVATAVLAALAVFLLRGGRLL